MGGGVKFTGNRDSVAAAGGRRLPAAIGGESELRSRSTVDSVFGSVPSRFEVEKAILDLRRLMRSLSGSEAEHNGVKGLLHDRQSKLSEASGFVKFLDAFSMMQLEPAFQNLVASISCDKAVWEAMLSNKAVRDLQASVSTVIYAAKEGKLLTCGEEPDIPILILNWIKDFTRSKILELIESFLSLVNEFLQPASMKKPTSDLTGDVLDEKVRSSFLLSVVIILIVIATRSQG